MLRVKNRSLCYSVDGAELVIDAVDGVDVDLL